MTIEELKAQRLNCLQKRFIVCENIQLIKCEKTDFLKDKTVFYHLIFAIIFSLLSLISVIPAFFLNYSTSKLCLLMLGSLCLLTSGAFTIKTIKNYSKVSKNFHQNRDELTRQYQQDLQELNMQIQNINYEIEHLNASMLGSKVDDLPLLQTEQNQAVQSTEKE